MRSSSSSQTRPQFYSPVRVDAPERGSGKPCGASYIPKQKKCSKPVEQTGSTINPTSTGAARIATTVAASAALVGGAVLLRRKFKTPDDWRSSPQNPRNRPKLSETQNRRIVDEAVQANDKWPVQEQINARRKADLCRGDSLEKTKAPTKLDAEVRKPRCQLGAGAFGTYFVHPSRKYGVKLFRESDSDMASWEFDRLSKAHAAGVNAPEPLAINSTNRDISTLTLRHMEGYDTVANAISHGGYTMGDAPLIARLKLSREFRKLHVEGLAHGDIHGGNIMINRTRNKVALIDFGYSTELSDYGHPSHHRSGLKNLSYDLHQLPSYLGLKNDGVQFVNKYDGVIENVLKQADYSNSNNDWDLYEVAVNRYHDLLELTLRQEAGVFKPRSRLLSAADQPRIPGLTRKLVEARWKTPERKVLEQMLQSPVRNGRFVISGSREREIAAQAGLTPRRLRAGLTPEQRARLARKRAQPFGTPL